MDGVMDDYSISLRLILIATKVLLGLEYVGLNLVPNYMIRITHHSASSGIYVSKFK